MSLFASSLDSYSIVYQDLVEMRELFHQTGRFDDSNAKLDEVVKLFAAYLAFKRGLISAFPIQRSKSQGLVDRLQACFRETVGLECYQNQDGTSIFGPSPTLALRESDEVLAGTLVSLVRNSVEAALSNKLKDNPFDVLNEAFGHFIRDNFRSNIEDAQYLTPPEVVHLMVEMAFEDIVAERTARGGSSGLTVVDPAVGVGSFLAAFYHKALASKAPVLGSVGLFGQDKVDRMVRLAKINLALFEALNFSVTIGNSLAKDSPLSGLNGQVDLILTNPPFGAQFSSQEITSFGVDNLPIFFPISEHISKVHSEHLFIDRSLSLLKEGGRLLIIVPDKIVSAKGISALLRQQLKSRAYVRAVIELPSVTFAQAGTRTKTCILYLVKGKYSGEGCPVFVANSANLGFEVSSRKGVQIKISNGENDLLRVLAAFKASPESIVDRGFQIIQDSPSCVRVGYEDFLEGSWTPNQYHASSLNAISLLKELPHTNATPLSKLVRFESETRKPRPWSGEYFFISVLHVLGEGLLDIGEIRRYRPKTPGLEVKPGEILLSKINPRIPRIIVVPDLKSQLLCSSEFEIMSVEKGVDPYLVTYLLLSKYVQGQINSLTSGTSASHNRIKREGLAEVLLPIPTPGTRIASELDAMVKKYRCTTESLCHNLNNLAELREGDPLNTQSATRSPSNPAKQTL